RAHLIRGLVRRASTDPASELRQCVYERRDLFGLEARCAAQHLVALDLPRQRKRWRLVDQPGHESYVEKSRSEGTLRRDHAIARVEISPFQMDRLAIGTIG